MHESCLRKHATQEFIASCLGKDLGIIIKISLIGGVGGGTSVENSYEVIIFT